MIKTLEAQVGQFLLGCKCPVSRGVFVQEQNPFGEFPAAFFLQNVLQLHLQRYVILRIDSLALGKIIIEEDAELIPKIKAIPFPANFCTRNFWGRVEPLCRHSIVVALSPDHSDITRFRPWSPIATGNHLDRAKKIPNLFRLLAPLMLLIRVQTFQDPLRGEFRTSKSS